MNTAFDPRIQSRPAIRLAIGDLPPVEQDHVRISLRIISPRLPLPCVLVQQADADITLKPCANASGNLCLVSRFGERHIDRPLRLVPLSDALSDLISTLLNQEGGRSSAADPSAPMTLTDLLHAPSQGQACRIQLQSGIVFELDRRHHSVRFRTADDIERVRGSDRIASNIPLDVQTSSQATHADVAATIQAEQLSWLLALDSVMPQQLQRWLQNGDDMLTMISWPNLSRQPDALAWIQVLTALNTRSLSINQTLQTAIDAGIAPQRARFGIALLCMFRHASLSQAALATTGIAEPVAAPAQATVTAAQSGLLGRLRNKLRSLLS